MSLLDSRTTRVLITASVFVLVGGFLYAAWRTLIAFLFAVFFAYLVDPAVSHVEKWTKSRGGAIAIIYLLIASFLAIFFFFVGPRIGHEAQKLTESLPTLFERVSSGQLVQEIGIEHGLSKATRDQLSAYFAAHSGDLLKLVQRAGLRIAEAAQQSWLVVLVPILAAFFLKDARAFSQGALALVHSKPQREFLEGVIGDMNQMLAQFIRAQLTLAALSWVAYASFLGLVKAPYALMLGTVGGILEFIPVVGPLVAALLIVGVALLTSYKHWLIVLLFLLAWRLVQDYVVSPRIMGKSMELHPLAAIFGVLAGGEIAGVLGVYLSIPVMASLRIVWRRWRIYAEKKRFGPLNEYSFLTETTSRQ
ncbi:MAG: AI-2E family transporter [Acidobacteria bacterium]|nr:AI-2E family transporter [Acidobacteriota bacterium]MBV9622851.1 AI-2E family transporter [Acidobacteriota bacterium]